MKIGFDAKRLFYNDTGLGNYARTLIKNLQKFHPNHQYFLFTPGLRETEETKYFFDKSRFTIIQPKRKDFFWRQWGISREINKLKLDIYHGLSHELPMRMPDKSTRCFVTVHDLIFEKFPHLYPWFDSKFYRIKYRRSAHLADHIISISNSTSKDIQDIWKIDKSKISTIYQTCNPAISTIAKSSRIRKHFLYVGSVIRRKRLSDIILALSGLEEAKKKPLVVIGSGDSYLTEVEKLINKLKISKWVHFIGKKSNKELVRYYDEAIALIYPSEYEGFGIPIIEAAFRKIPVITSTSSSMPEAGGPVSFYVEPGDIAQIKNYMDEISSNSDKIESRVNKTFQYVSEHFDARLLSNQLMSTYQQV